MPEYSDRSKAICLAALAEARRILHGCGVDFRVIGGSAVLEVMETRSSATAPVDYVGTLDVDLATRLALAGRAGETADRRRRATARH